jgi:hypothetical protein
MSLTVYGYKSSGGFSQIGFLAGTAVAQNLPAPGRPVWLVKAGAQLKKLMPASTIALAVWDTDGTPNELLVTSDRYSLPFSASAFTTERALNSPLLLDAAQNVSVGYLPLGTASGDINDFFALFQGGASAYFRGPGLSVTPDPFGTATGISESGLRVWVYGQVNRAPNTPTNIAPSNGATLTTAQPVISGDFRDPDETLQDTNGATLFGVGSADKLAAYQIVIKLGGVTKWNSGPQDANGSMQTARRFTATCPVTLGSGNYTLQTRVQDQAGAWSAWSNTTFSVATAAVVLQGSPTGKITDLSPDFQATFVTTGTDSTDQAKVRILKNGGVIGTSGAITFTVGPNATGTITYASTGFADRGAGVDYQYQVQMRYGASHLWTPWSDPRSFRTNGAPNKPAISFPSGQSFGRPAYPTITATVRDDDDADNLLTVATEVTRPDNSVITLSNPTYNYQTKQWAQTTGPTTIPAGNDGTYKVRVRGTDPLGAVGPWSDYATFGIGNFPAITNVTVTPTDGTNITGAPVTFTWQTAGTSTPTASQQARRVITITDAATGEDVLVSDHPFQTTTYTTSNTTWERNETDYLYTIAVTDGLGLVGTYSGSFHVSYTPPDQPTGVNAMPLGSDYDRPGQESMAQIQWDQSSADPGTWLAYDVSRWDGSSWILIGSVETQEQTAYLDPIPPLGAVSYAVTQRVQVNEAEVSSDPALAEVVIAFDGMVLTDVAADATDRVTCLGYERRDETVTPDVVYLPSWSGPPLALQGAATSRRMTVTAKVESDVWRTQQGLPGNQTTVDAILGLANVRVTDTGIAPRVLCYRDNRGRRLFCQFDGDVTAEDDAEFNLTALSFTLREVAFIEGAG